MTLVAAVAVVCVVCVSEIRIAAKVNLVAPCVGDYSLVVFLADRGYTQQQVAIFDSRNN